MAPPIFSPKDRLIIKYSPPPSTRWLVAISEIAIAGGIVTPCTRRIIPSVPKNPRLPTAHPNLRNNTAPKIVEIAVKNTAAPPSLPLFDPKVVPSPVFGANYLLPLIIKTIHKNLKR